MTCDAGPHFLPACTMTTVESVGDISAATQQLQNSVVPLVLTPLHNLDFGGADWPADGLSVTSNVTISSLYNVPVTIDFQLKTLLFRVETRSAQAFLMFRGCVLLNLPLTYLPLEHPRRPFGILSTGLWPVYRYARASFCSGARPSLTCIGVVEFQTHAPSQGGQHRHPPTIQHAGAHGGS